MVKYGKEKKSSLMKKSVFAMLTLYRRRLEYAIVISLIFIFLGYMLKAIKTNDYNEVGDFLTLSYRALNHITVNIVPVTAIFALFCLSITCLLYPKAIQVVGALITLSAILLIFFIPAEITTNYLIIMNEAISEYQNLLFLAVGVCLVLILRFKKTRIWLLHTLKYMFEIALFSVIFYFAGLYRTFNLGEFLQDYWKVFQHGVTYLSGFTDVAILVYLGIVFFLIYSSTIRAIRFHAKRHRQLKKQNILNQEIACDKNVKTTRIMLEDKDLPKIGICVPAYNEQRTASKTIDSILKCDYPASKCEILIVADGSTDNTVLVVTNRYSMKKLPDSATKPVFRCIKHKEIKEVWQSTIYPNLKLLVKVNGGKFDALNAGLQYFSEDVKYMSVIDADTTLCENAFRLLATEAMNSKGVLALAGAILPRDDYKWYELKKLIFTQWQHFDYLCSFHISRGSLSFLNAMMIVSGAYGFFDRYMVLAVLGYKESLGEDIYLTLELQKEKSAIIKYIPESIAYTQVPTTFDMARKQRMRWFKGLTEGLYTFKKMWIENPKMAIAFAEFFVVEWVTPLLAPYGFAVLLARPSMIHNRLFQISITVAIITPMIQAFVGMCVESSYRTVKWWRLFYLPIQVFMSPLVILWRNDGILDFSSKVWGKMIRS